MLKTLKRSVALVMVFVFVLSLVPTVSFAVDAAKGDWLWTGDDKPTYRNSKATSGNKIYYGAIEIGHDPVYGKSDGDKVYKVYDHATATHHSLATSGDFTLQDGVAAYKDCAMSFSFAFHDIDDAIGMSFEYYSTLANLKNGTRAGITDFLTLNTTSNKFFGSTFDYNFEPKKWYNVCVVIDCENEQTYANSDAAPAASYTHKLYVNGRCASTIVKTNQRMYDPCRLRLGNGGFGDIVYWDNVEIQEIPNALTYDPGDAKAATITSVQTGVDVIDNTIAAPEAMTIGELKNAISISSDASAVRIYNNDYSRQLTDSDLAKDANIVLASKRIGTDMENTYSYYSVEKWVKKYPGLNSGTTILSLNSTASSNQKMEVVTGNLGGKDNDSYIMWCDSDGITERIVPIGNASAPGQRDVLEMSVYIPSGSNGFSFRNFLSDTAGTDATGFALWVKSDGIYAKWSDPNPSRICRIEPDKWHNIAIVTPAPYTDGSNPAEKILEVYVNGKKYTANTNPTKSGFRYLWAKCFGNGSVTPAVYFDNIRVYNGEYAPEYDVTDNIEYKDIIDENNNIILKGKVTVAELKSDIAKKEDTTIRVYESISSTNILPDSALIEDGCVVVAAAKNNAETERSYNYYTVKKVNNEVNVSTFVNGSVDKFYDEDDTLSVSVQFNNYTNDDTFNAKVYTAQYKYGELINIWETDSQVIEAGETKTFICDFAGIDNKENSSIKVMVVNDNLEPYCKYSTMRYASADSPATLYLMGDSIVQTYVNETYPIQGWGYYLDDYLNDYVKVENRATSGWTTDHYLYPDGVYTRENGLHPVGTELLDRSDNKKIVGESNRYKTWESIKSTLKSGDYVMLALGINDAGTGNVPKERYEENIETICAEAAALGATTILMTPSITGRDWNDTADFRQDYEGRGDICKAIAQKYNLICLPFGAELIMVYNEMVEDYIVQNPNATAAEAKNYVRNYFHLYGASSTTPPPGWNDFGSKKTDDNLHYNFVGANKAASIIAKLLSESGSPLGDYVVITR